MQCRPFKQFACRTYSTFTSSSLGWLRSTFCPKCFSKFRMMLLLPLYV